LRIGPHHFPEPVVFLAPMAGVSDRPFRVLCRRLGASAAVSEIVTSDTGLWNTGKSRLRLDHRGETAPRIVQLLGNDPPALARAALENVARGAEIIDLNLGCPAKKVCQRAAGSALLGDEALVERILRALTSAVPVPVTLKMRLGVDPGHINAPRIASLAEAAGVSMISVHGRTRACGYGGRVDYDAIARVVATVDIPVLANGDIVTAEQARTVLERTGAAGLMVGRGAQGQPWLPGQIRAALAGARVPATPTGEVLARIVLEHVAELHRHYGPAQGLRVARKHIGWYLQQNRPEADRRQILELTDPDRQLAALAALFRGSGKDRVRSVAARSGTGACATPTRDSATSGGEAA
jgi:tRNA-dihydrouridine synthase B